MLSSEPGKEITLASSDGEVFTVEKAVAAESQVINHLIEDDYSADNVIPLPNITGKILSNVIEYCKRHVDAAAVKADDKLACTDDIKAFDTDFVKVDQPTLLDLNLAAEYLNIKSLMCLTSQTLTPSDPIKKLPFGGLTEAWLPDSPDSPFRDNVRRFIQQCAKRKDYDMEGMPVWLTMLEDKKREAYLPLYIIEEDVRRSTEPFCNYCSPAGWGGHFLSKMSYHFIIPSSEEWNNELDEGTFELETHLLHGLIHIDGNGHLVCINGIEGGSKFIPGREIMDFWEHICSSLGVRKISVCDVTRKHGVDLRLLYGVCYGGSWFSKWGYQFCRGTFGSNEDDYWRSIDILSSMELDRVIAVFSPKKEGRNISEIIEFYRGESDEKLVTLRDIFGFMLNLKSKDPSDSCIKEIRYKRYSDIVKYTYNRWSTWKLNNIGSLIVGDLLEKRSRNEGSDGRMTRLELLDRASPYIIDSEELFSLGLKLMNNVVVEDLVGVKGKYIVRRGVNMVTKMQEYSIYDFKEDCLSAEAVGKNVEHDMRYLYKSVLIGYPQESEPVGDSVQKILQSKHLVKEFSLGDNNNMVRYDCLVTNWSRDRGIPVGVFKSATLDDLKKGVENEMRDVYCIADNVEVLKVAEVYSGSGGSMVVWLDCRGLDADSRLKFQGGTKKVICKCGARDDDGEMMVLCFICMVWQHVRCVGYVPMAKMGSSICRSCSPPPVKSKPTFILRPDLPLKIRDRLRKRGVPGLRRPLESSKVSYEDEEMPDLPLPPHKLSSCEDDDRTWSIKDEDDGMN